MVKHTPTNTPNAGVAATPKDNVTQSSSGQESLEIEIAKQEGKLAHKTNRTPFYIFVGALLMAGLGYALFGRQFLASTPLATHVAVTYAPLIGGVFFLYILLVTSYTAMLRNVRERQAHQDLEVLRARKRATQGSEVSGAQVSYFDRLVNINVSNLEAYYLIVKNHTNNSFIASVSAGFVGFLLIITGLIAGFSGLGACRE